MTNLTPYRALCFAGGEGIQTLIRLPLPNVRGNKDYDKREARLTRMDELLQVSGIEDKFLTSQVALFYANLDPSVVPQSLSRLRLASIHRQAKQSLPSSKLTNVSSQNGSSPIRGKY